MILQICAVYDKKIGAYMVPSYFRTKGEALRSFMDACAQENHPFKKHAFDYVFCLLGTYDDESGTHQNVSIPEILLDAASVVANPPLTNGLDRVEPVLEGANLQAMEKLNRRVT